MAIDSRVFEEIEAFARNYPPATYSSLLRFYNDIQIETDALSSDFIPLSLVRPNPKIFAIGLLPPGIHISGKLLDRSGTTFDAGGDLEIDPNTTGVTDRNSTDGIKSRGNANSHKQAKPILIDAFKSTFGRDPTNAELQYLAAIGYLESSYGQGWGNTFDEDGNTPMVGSNNWGAVQCASTADQSNCIAFQDSYPDGTKYPVSFRKYETPADGAKDLVRHVFVLRDTAKGLENGGSAMRASYIMRRQSYYGGFCRKALKDGKATARDAKRSLGHPDENDGTKACAEEAIKDHAELLVMPIAKGFAEANGDPLAFGLGNYGDAEDFWFSTLSKDRQGHVEGDVEEDGVDWIGLGATAVAAIWAERSKIAGSSIAGDTLDKKLLAAQAAQVVESKFALEAMKRVPPLRMMVNPQKFGVKGQKITTDGAWTRNGVIVEHWGNDQDVISASGKVAGFYAIQSTAAAGTGKSVSAAGGTGFSRNGTGGISGTNISAGPGLTRAARNFSLSWQNFQSLYLLYRNNGGMFINDYMNPGSDNQRTNLSVSGSIYIYYDSTLYIGSFNSFSITENDAAPHTIEYSFEFNVRAAFLLDRTDDVFTYGAPNLFRRSSNSTFNAVDPTSGDITKGNPNTDTTVHGAGVGSAADDGAVPEGWEADELNQENDPTGARRARRQRVEDEIKGDQQEPDEQPTGETDLFGRPIPPGGL